MPEKHSHKVLIVDDDENRLKNSFHEIMFSENVELVSANGGKAGLSAIRSETALFSLVISEQALPDMKGTDFLEQVKRICPGAIRILITGYSQMATITQAVNKGLVHRYISKPWEQEELSEAVQSGIQRFEQFQNDEKLFALAKKQNTRLYELNCELMEMARTHDRKVSKLNEEIESLEQVLETNGQDPSIDPDRLINEILKFIKNSPNPQHALDRIFSDTMGALFQEFNVLAQENGFEMDRSGSEVTHG